MKICLFAVLLGVCTLASAQLDGGGNLAGGGGGGGGAGGMAGGRFPTRAGGGMGNPMNTMLMSSMAGNDALPAMMMMNHHPGMMKNPMGALVMSNAFGIDVNKIAGPMAMLSMGGGAGGARRFMPWMPLMTGDPSALGMALSMGGGMMNPLSFMAMANM